MTESEIENIVDILRKTTFSSYQIAKCTGISQASISYWKRGIKKPSRANALLLNRFFEKEKRKDILANKEMEIKELMKENEELKQILKKLQTK
jgi:predicted transcriptional regulator